MDKLNFYHQKRADGGLRSGIDFNGERVLESYEPGKLPQNSALLWFIDIRCSAKKLPAEPESIRRWLLERADVVQSALQQFAEELRAGMDRDWPLKKTIPTNDGVQMAVFCSAMRRATGREISQVLLELGEAWPTLIDSLDSYEHPLLAHG